MGETKKKEFQIINLQALGGLLFVFAILSAPIYNKYDLVYKETIPQDPCRKEVEELTHVFMGTNVIWTAGHIFIAYILKQINNNLYLAYGWYIFIVYQFVGADLEAYLRGGPPECAYTNPSADMDFLLAGRMTFFSLHIFGLEMIMGTEIVPLNSFWNYFASCTLMLVPEVDENGNAKYVKNWKEYLMNLGYWILKLGVTSIFLPYIVPCVANAQKLVLMNPDDFWIKCWFTYFKAFGWYIFMQFMFEIYFPLMALGGLKCKDQLAYPILSTSFTELWSMRWNKRIHTALKNCVYKPSLRFFAPNKSQTKQWHKFVAIIAVFLYSGWIHELDMLVMNKSVFLEDIMSGTWRFFLIWTKFMLINAAVVIGENIFEKYINQIPDFIRCPVVVLAWSFLVFDYLLEYNTVWREIDHPLDEFTNFSVPYYDWVLKESA